jgi:predicted metal-dependent HD superfamily phosphohydrolase
MAENLNTRWYDLFPTADTKLLSTLFTKISKNYQSRSRYYHNLTHIAAMLELSDEYAALLQQKDVVDLAIFYHDVIYNPLRKDNEERSAKRAVRDLTKLRWPKEEIQLVETYILATKTHNLQGFGNESDLAYLLDFDLSVLGAAWSVYSTYRQHIRKEYSTYPYFIYNPGRAKVLRHFLKRPAIYYTKIFQQEREKQARENLQRELQLL